MRSSVRSFPSRIATTPARRSWTRRIPRRPFRRSSRCGRRRVRRTCSSCCSTTSASPPRARSEGPARRRPPSASPRAGSSSTASTRPRSARRRRQAMLTGRNHHTVGMGGITEIATSAPGYTSMRPNTCAPLAETLRLNGYSTAQFGKCHEVPVWETSPMGPFDRWPSPRRRVRVLLRLHRRRDEPVLPGALRGDDPDRARADARGGLPPHRRPGRQGDQLGPPAEGADAGQALLRLLRARRDPRTAPRRARVVGQVQGPLRPGLGRAPRGDVRPPEGARRDPGRRGADRARPTRSPPGTTCPTRSSPCWRGRWRCTPASSSTPTTTSAGSSTRSTTSACSTTRSSTTSSATTGRAPRGRSTGRSTSTSR